MANTYTQIYIQYVFAVQNRISLIKNEWKDELYKYMTGIINQHEHKLLSIGGMTDHIHALVSMHPKQAPSLWINENKFVVGKFSWQEGFGAFSYSQSQISRVSKYIENQETHHKKKTFREEYLDFLKAFNIEFDERYVYKEIE